MTEHQTREHDLARQLIRAADTLESDARILLAQNLPELADDTNRMARECREAAGADKS